MKKEKLEKAANDFARGYSFSDETLKDCSFYSYVAGARWLQSQPLADRLTEKEKEKIKGKYFELKEINSVCDDMFSDDTALFEWLFGKEMFENKE